jgi:betaine-aldehyde dehydrogenase
LWRDKSWYSVGMNLKSTQRIGSLISERHLNKVLNYTNIGIEEGATLFCGGERLRALGELYLSPVVFTNVRHDIRIVREEMFGYVVTGLFE